MKPTERTIALSFAAIFILAGLLLLPYPGIQNDEAMFASPLYPPHFAVYKFRGVPIMWMDYVGCLKTWIYAGIFAIFPPSPWSLRLPVILIGALSIYLFSTLLTRLGGVRCACIGGTLLVTDPVFALTNNFDWGPVALQHFLLIAGLLAAMQFHRVRHTRWLAIAAFSFGLGLWDKALFIWLLVPICFAALLLWPHAVRSALTLRNITAACGAFTLGAAPLLWFNVTHQWVTFRSHTVFSLAELPAKLKVLHWTANGSVLFDYMVQGPKRADLLEYALALAVLALPFLWNTEVRKPALFSLLVMASAWAQMALNRDTGGGAHHTVLLWPLPQLLIAVVFAKLRWFGPAATAVVALSSLLVYHQYWSNFRTEGPSLTWTDALPQLATDPALAEANAVCIIDWGIVDPLIVLRKGRLPLRAGTPEALAFYVNQPNTLWVSHLTGQELIPGINTRLFALATAQGYRLQPGRIYNDHHGHPVYQLFKFLQH